MHESAGAQGPPIPPISRNSGRDDRFREGQAGPGWSGSEAVGEAPEARSSNRLTRAARIQLTLKGLNFRSTRAERVWGRVAFAPMTQVGWLDSTLDLAKIAPVSGPEKGRANRFAHAKAPACELWLSVADASCCRLKPKRRPLTP